MPGQDQYVAMPDGSYVHIPGDTSPDQLAQFRNKLSSSTANLKTGEGMEAAAHAQATPKPGELPGVPSGGAPPTGNAGTAERPLVTPKMGESFSDTMGRGVEMGKRVTPEQRESAKNTAMAETPEVIGAAMLPAAASGIAEGVSSGIPGLLRMGKTALMAGVGAKVGSKAGEKIGSYINPEAAKVGDFAGGVVGGLGGGMLSSATESNPFLNRIANESTRRISPTLAEALFPDALRGEEAKAAFMNRGYKSMIPEPKPVPTPKMGRGITFTAERPQTQGFVPRMSAPPVEEFAARQAAARPALPPAPEGTPESVAGTRSLVLTPSEASSEEQIQRMAPGMAKRRGMQFAAGMTPREGRKVPRSPTRMTSEEYPPPRERMRF